MSRFCGWVCAQVSLWYPAEYFLILKRLESRCRLHEGASFTFLWSMNCIDFVLGNGAPLAVFQRVTFCLSSSHSYLIDLSGTPLGQQLKGMQKVSTPENLSDYKRWLVQNWYSPISRSLHWVHLHIFQEVSTLPTPSFHLSLSLNSCYIPPS